MLDLEQKIHHLYQKNEKRTIQMLFEHYYESLILYVNSIVQDKNASEDIIQDFFIQLWETDRLKKFHGNLEGYLFQSVKNRAINYLRDQQRRTKLYEKSSFENMEKNVHIPIEESSSHDIEYLYQIVNQLPPRCRKIFFMSVLDQMKQQDIADRLDITVNTVKMQMKIALKYLRKHLDKNKLSSLLFLLFKNNQKKY